jgi:hypothetical protein
MTLIITECSPDYFYDGFLSDKNGDCGEHLDREYKEVTLNTGGIKIGLSDILTLCQTNIFTRELNEGIIANIKTLIELYLSKNISAFLNANIFNGEIYFGINDYGIIKGIPYSGELPYEELALFTRELLKSCLMFASPKIKNDFDINKFVNIEFIKIDKPSQPEEKHHPEFIKYLEEYKLYLQVLKEHKEIFKDWKVRFDFVNQKLCNLINNYESRIILIAFIKSINPSSPVIQLLESNYKETPKVHEEVILLKDDETTTYYWVTRWKDIMIPMLRKEKPIAPKPPSNTPINLIMNVSEMIPWWVNSSDGMNLYIIKITLDTDFDFDNEYVYYYDIYKKKWVKCKRILLKDGNPSCYPIIE